MGLKPNRTGLVPGRNGLVPARGCGCACSIIIEANQQATGCAWSFSLGGDCEGTHTYLWDFGDGSTSTAAAPSHTYADPGTTYLVTVIVDAGTDCAVGASTKVRCTCPADDPEITGFNVIHLGDCYYKISANIDSTQEIEGYNWQLFSTLFGVDAFWSTTDETFVIQLIKDDQVRIKLTVVDELGCRDTYEQTVGAPCPATCCGQGDNIEVPGVLFVTFDDWFVSYPAGHPATTECGNCSTLNKTYALPLFDANVRGCRWKKVFPVGQCAGINGNFDWFLELSVHENSGYLLGVIVFSINPVTGRRNGELATFFLETGHPCTGATSYNYNIRGLVDYGEGRPHCYFTTAPQNQDFGTVTIVPG